MTLVYYQPSMEPDQTGPVYAPNDLVYAPLCKKLLAHIPVPSARSGAPSVPSECCSTLCMPILCSRPLSVLSHCAQCMVQCTQAHPVHVAVHLTCPACAPVHLTCPPCVPSACPSAPSSVSSACCSAPSVPNECCDALSVPSVCSSGPKMLTACSSLLTTRFSAYNLPSQRCPAHAPVLLWQSRTALPAGCTARQQAANEQRLIKPTVSTQIQTPIPEPRSRSG